MLRAALAGAILAGLIAGPAQAQPGYPNKPVKILVPTAAGGLADTIARMYAAHLSKVLGQQFYIENRGGAGNTLGIESVARSPADGYTLLLGAGTITINHVVYRKLPYDVMRDFTPVTQMVSVPNVLVVHPAQPFNSLARLHRRRQGEARHDQLRLRRRRQQSAPVDGALEDHDRDRCRPCPLQGRRPRDVGPAGWTRDVDGVERRFGQGACGERQAARARR